jgi:hypothetical protein
MHWAKLASRPGGRFANVKLRCPNDNKDKDITLTRHFQP